MEVQLHDIAGSFVLLRMTACPRIVILNGVKDLSQFKRISQFSKQIWIKFKVRGFDKLTHGYFAQHGYFTHPADTSLPEPV